MVTFISPSFVKMAEICLSTFITSTSSSHQQTAFSGIEPPNKRRKIEESSRVFDVFINHRGPDVKETLATQLYNSLKALGISAFLDSEEKELGNSFTSIIETGIRSASVHIAIFSKGYAQSAWCLAELVLMLQTNAKIIPVFYQVKPSELRYIEKGKGVYAEAFHQYEKKGRYLDKLKEWKEALQKVSYTAGYEFKSSESSDCKDIVCAVEKEVNRSKRLHVAKYPVGLHELIKDFERQCLHELVEDSERKCLHEHHENYERRRFEELFEDFERRCLHDYHEDYERRRFEELFEDFGRRCLGVLRKDDRFFKRERSRELVRDFQMQHFDMFAENFHANCLNEMDNFEMDDFENQRRQRKSTKSIVVGIFGMGGVGKTTLSKELFNQKSSKYTRTSILIDVREACTSGKLPSLQSKLLKDIFCEDHNFLSSEEGTSCLRDRLVRNDSFSFLIVLDDIDHVDQLEALLPMDIVRKHGHNLVIITTRDAGILVRAGIDNSYHLKGLDREDGRELLCWHAFDQCLPLCGYEDLVEAFVDMCGGLPLSLIVLGRHVCGRTQWYWQDELEKVRDALPGDIKRILKISVDSLSNVEKQIFMDTACFFVEQSITKAVAIWEGSGWRPRHALQTLKEKCLVDEVQINYLNWKDEKWESSPEGSALIMHDHLRDLGRDMANDLIHPRRTWHPRDLKSLESKGFQNILAQTNCRCFHSIVDESMDCRITYFLGEPKDRFDTSLLWVQFEYLSHRSLTPNSDISCIPPWIPLENLQCLRISNGCFHKLCQSDEQVPSHLKELQIRDTFLEEFPDFFGKLNNMEKLILPAKAIDDVFRLHRIVKWWFRGEVGDRKRVKRCLRQITFVLSEDTM